GLHYLVKLFGFALAGGGEGIERGIKILKLKQRTETHTGGEDVIGGLSVIDVVIWVDEIFAELATHDLSSAVGDDLVGIHVEADAGSGLEDVNHEFLVPLAVGNFSGGGDDGVGTLVVNECEFFVSERGRLLDEAEGADERGMRAHAADRVVFDRARRLHAVI